MTVQCDISYSTDPTEIGQPGSFTDAPMENGSMGETVSFPLTEPLPPNTTYYYQVVAFSADQRVTVKGDFSTGNYSGGKILAKSSLLPLGIIRHAVVLFHYKRMGKGHYINKVLTHPIFPCGVQIKA